MKFLFILVVIFFIHNQVDAQNAFVSIGGNLSSEKASVSFSVGQTAYQSILGSAGNLNQGVQQPYEIYELSTTYDIALNNFECNAFPNPTNDLLILSIKNKDSHGLSYQLVNSTGRLLNKDDITEEETILSMKTFPSAVYFLRLIEDKKTVRTFKIIKH